MKKLKNIVIMIILAVAAFACTDVLDKGPLDKYSENDVWKSTDLTQAFIYTALKNATDMMIWKDNWTDNEAILEDGRNINFELIDRYHDAGWNVYGDIRRCNMVLTRVPDAPFTEVEKANFIAQAKTIRAMIYFTRARLFGKLMLVKDLIDTDADMTFSRTTTIKETYDFIIKDLQEAVSDLHVDEPTGAVSRGVGYALLGEVALHGAAYIENGQDDYYKIAAKACEDLFALNKYSLDKDYAGMFNNYDHSLSSSEIILAQWRSQENTTFSDTWMQRLVPNIDPSKLTHETQEKYPLVEECAGWPQRFPSVSLVNDYLVIDEDGQAKEWDQTSYYKDFLTNGGTVNDAIYKNRDKRFYRAILANGMSFKDYTIETFKGGADDGIVSQGGSPTGYFLRKYIQEATSFEPGKEAVSKHHWVIYRYAETLLTYAESMVNAFNDVNYTDETYKYSALWAINEVRKNADMPLIPSMGKDEFMERLYNEWRVEFAFEDHRFWDVRRWKIADTTQRELYGVKIEKQADGTFNFYKNLYETRNWRDCMYLYPIPQSELYKNTNLNPQNTGW